MSAKIISTKSTSTIFSTNKINEVEINHDKKVEADSEFREVIKKGYLLNKINLSTIPDVIKDAIDKAIIDAKNQTLADSLIETLKQSLENLDDGVYKKTYIDNMMTYVENLLTSKVNLETVASIADSKLAVALQDYASTTQVELLNSRVGNSESEITNIKETINTKDSARATQIEELEASIEDTFAGYSNAIDLYVDADGNVKSQKIETLSTNIGLQLQELNELIVDKDNEWNAKSIKLITSPTGAITGYSFQNGSGLKSTFEINADNFKIANSTNTYTPFSIVDNNITFNGKVSFSNTTTSTGATLTDVLDDLTNLLNENSTATLLEISNLDEKIDAKEQELINSINAEASTRAAQITARINAEALLNGKIDAEETARINAATALETALKNYTDVVADALIDGEISAAEQNAINEAQIRVDTAKTQLITMINNLTKVEDISWQSEVQNAINNNATTIDGGKIVTNEVFVNNLNAVGGIIAENISANELVGKTITGGVINGARINGAVIKASYLDLDGELEVLTNYHITVAMYNANPSLYTDAVYISADNEYRIPSISTIYNAGSATQSYKQNNVVKYMYISDQIKSYNTANVGHNIKAVKITPKISILTSSTYYYSDRSLVSFGEPYNVTVPLCSFYVNNIEVARCFHYFISNGFWAAKINDVQNGNILSSSTKRWGASTTFTAMLSNGLSVTLQIQGSTDSESGTSSYIYTVNLNPCVITPINQFTSGNLLHMSYYSYYIDGIKDGRTYAYNPPANISINNMI